MNLQMGRRERMSFEVAKEPTEAEDDKAYREYLCEFSRFPEWDKMWGEEEDKKDYGQERRGGSKISGKKDRRIAARGRCVTSRSCIPNRKEVTFL